MATVINNPTPTMSRREVVVDRDSDSRSGAGFVLGVILAVILGIIILAYAIPALRNSTRGNGVNIPSRVDLNVNGGTTGGTSGTGTTAQ